MKKLVIAGGTGFLGNALVKHFSEKFDAIIVLSRSAKEAKNKVQFVQWDAKNLGAWQVHLEDAEVLINLTGRSVDCRYNAKNKAEILNSRLDSTAVLNAAVLMCANPPKHFVNSSTATIYDHSLTRPNTEKEGVIGSDFSMDVAKSWEATFFNTSTPNTLKTALRTSIVLGNAGGAFPKMRGIAAVGLGGKQGQGNQMISWIHVDDFVKAVEFVIDNQLAGVVNVTAPNPVQNTYFMKTLRETLGVRVGINAPKSLLEIAAFFMRTQTELLLKSRFVIPERLIESGFEFKYPDIERCLEYLVKK